MATDREVLIFIHERLEHFHGEKDIVDYMHSLRRVIAGLPPGQRSPDTCTNGLNELLRKLPRIDGMKREGWLTRWARQRIEQVEQSYTQPVT